MTPRPTIIFEPFELIVVPFPFADSPATKPQPALVLSSRGFNKANVHTVLAMITRATHTRWSSDHVIDDLAPTGWRDPSVVRFEMFTLDNRVLQRSIGRLSGPDTRACATALDTIFSSQSPASGADWP